MKTKSTLVKCKCEICGKEFMWKKHVTICQEKSTCRVLKHQRKVAKETLERKANMMSMDAVALYNEILHIAPEMKSFLAAFMNKYDAETNEDMMIIVYNAMDKTAKLFD